MLMLGRLTTLESASARLFHQSHGRKLKPPRRGKMGIRVGFRKNASSSGKNKVDLLVVLKPDQVAWDHVTSLCKTRLRLSNKHMKNFRLFVHSTTNQGIVPGTEITPTNYSQLITDKIVISVATKEGENYVDEDGNQHDITVYVPDPPRFPFPNGGNRNVTQGHQPKVQKVYVDLDGVLADFAKGVSELSPSKDSNLSQEKLWTLIRKSDGFFERLPMMDNALDLWDFLSQAVGRENIYILSGLPKVDTAIVAEQKRKWVSKHLGLPLEQVILCMANEKRKYSGPGMVLIDDDPEHKPFWEERGGSFVCHETVPKTLQELETSTSLKVAAPNKFVPTSPASVFPLLEGDDVLDQVRQVVKDYPQFEEIYHHEGDYVTFDYKALESFPSNSKEELLFECRGLVIGKTSGRVLGRRYHKFFNFNECERASMSNNPLLQNLAGSVLLEKLDGTLVAPFLTDANALVWSARNYPMPSVQKFVTENQSYQDLARFWLSQGYSPLFEWLDNTQSVGVIEHEQSELVLTGIRENRTGNYVPYHIIQETANEFQVSCVSTLGMNIQDHSLEQILDFIKNVKNCEGAVLVLPDGNNRFKIKTDWYLNELRTRKGYSTNTSTTPKKLTLDCWRIILSDDFDDLFPPIAQEFVENGRCDNVEEAIANATKIRDAVNTLHQDISKWVESVSTSATSIGAAKSKMKSSGWERNLVDQYFNPQQGSEKQVLHEYVLKLCEKRQWAKLRGLLQLQHLNIDSVSKTRRAKIELYLGSLLEFQDKRVFCIMRGIPGSGKSSLTREITTFLDERKVSWTVCSADSFFETSGRYVFDPKLLPQAHEHCQSCFAQSQSQVVIVDNTNTKKWEYAFYEKVASENNGSLLIFEIPCESEIQLREFHQRNTHGVPLEAMRAMFLRFEHDPRAKSM